MKSLTRILDEVRVIQKSEGYKYFISKGSRTSQGLTGGSDYWQYVYEAVIGEKDGHQENWGAIRNLTELNETLRDFVKAGDNLLYVEVKVEHVSTNCRNSSFTSPGSPDIHCHTEHLGFVWDDMTEEEYYDL